MPRCWYIYTGGTVTTLHNYNKYINIGGSPSPVSPGSCLGGFSLCAIYAPNCGDNPSFLSQNIRNYITRALGQGTNQPDEPIGARIYVVVKPS